MSQGPLEGVVVVALEQAVSAPFSSRHLGDMGARVIKIERVEEGDFTRHYDAEVRGMASHFVWVNRNKESLALDYKAATGREILDDFIATADVVIQNLAPGTAERMGLAARQLVNRYPELIACDISGYGDEGPYASNRAYDLLVQAEAASIATTGWPDRPAKPGIAIADLAAGLYTYSSVLAGLDEREKTGRVGVQNDREWRRLAIDVLGPATAGATSTRRSGRSGRCCRRRSPVGGRRGWTASPASARTPARYWPSWGAPTTRSTN